MSSTLRLCIWLIALSLSFNILPPATRASAVQISADETVLRSIVENFFNSWAAKDLEGFLRLWSAESPELEARRKETQELFAGSERIELRGLTIRAVKMAGVQARVRVDINVRMIEAGTGKEKAGYGKTPRTLECVKEAGHWRVRREVSTFDEIASALAAAVSEQQRTALLAEEGELAPAGLTRALINQGNRFFERGDYPQALAIHRLAQGMAERHGDREGIARAQNSIGNVHWAQGDYAQALDYFRKSLALSDALGNQTGVSNTLRNIGNIHYSQGDYVKALESFRKGLELSEKLGDRAGIARSLGSLGVVYDSQGDYARALEYYGKCLKLFEALADMVGMARTQGNIGIVRHELGNYAESLESHRQSLRLFEDKGDKAGIARTLNNLGNLYSLQGNHDQALAYYRKSLIPREAMGDKPGISKTLAGIGNIHFEQSNYAQALQHYRQSLAMSEAMGDKAGIADRLNKIGLIYDLQGNYAEALGHFRQSLAMREALGDKAGIAYTLNNIGIAHRRQGAYAQALERFQESLAISEALGHKVAIAVGQFNLGSVYYLQGNYARALEFAERSATVARPIGTSNIRYESLAMAGHAYMKLNKPAEASQTLSESIAIIETLRAKVAGGEEERQRVFASKVDSYHAMAELLISQGRPAEALVFAERAKARVLLDVLQTGRVNVAKALTGAEQEQEQKLRADLTSLNIQITRDSQKDKPDQPRLDELKSLREKARLSYEAFQTSLYAAHPELRVQRGEAPVIKADEITALLPDSKSALLEYVVTDDVTYLFVAAKAVGKSSADVRVYTLRIKRDELAKQTEGFRRQLADRDLGFRASARGLYQLLLKPARAQLQGRTNLVIVPDDKLWELPFQALLAEGDRYVIERSAVSYAPSLTVLREMRAQREKRRADSAPSALLALGNPAIGRETIERATLSAAWRQARSAARSRTGSEGAGTVVRLGAEQNLRRRRSPRRSRQDRSRPGRHSPLRHARSIERRFADVFIPRARAGRQKRGRTAGGVGIDAARSASRPGCALGLRNGARSLRRG